MPHHDHPEIDEATSAHWGWPVWGAVIGILLVIVAILVSGKLPLP